MTISPPVKIFGLVAALVAVAGALALFLLRPAPTALPPAAAAVPKARSLPVRSLPAPTKLADAAPARPTPAAPRRLPKPLVASGLPASIDAALRRHRVVVVSLVVPGATVDEIAAQEARAAAALSGVGYLALNALDESVARPLLTKLGPLPDTTVLVFKRGGAVATTLSGFADRETVAQAAASASS